MHQSDAPGVTSVENVTLANAVGLFPGRSHTVQFYESDDFLARAVGSFVATGVAVGQPVVILATETHRELFARALADQGLTMPKLGQDGGIHVLDAAETLQTVMGGDLPDPERFRLVLGGVLDRATGGDARRPVRAYGELVDVLSNGGCNAAAQRLEELWNELGASHNLVLLCGHALRNFDRDGDGGEFERVCQQHGRVMPTESYSQLFDDTSREREVSRLQQRTRALQTTIAHEGLQQASQAARAEAARLEAEHANRLKDEFLAVLTHELRTPLNAIVGWASIASSDLLADETTIRRALKVIQRNAAMQLRLIDDLLDLSHVMTGQMALNVGPVDLVAIADAATDSVRPSAAARGLTLDVRMPAQAVYVLGDAQRLQQVIWNLLGNAVKFTSNAGLVELRIDRDAVNGHPRLTVRDTGEGIVPELLPHVFERFRQGDSSSTRKHGGLGLGLSLVKYLVEAHGGDVSAESDGPGRGSVFTVTLPAA